MAKVKVKTNALRQLDQHKISYEAMSYDVGDGVIDGVSVAHKINRDVSEVFKTLLVLGKSKQVYVCVIPVACELSFKKISQLTQEKKVEMLPVGELLKTTGYVRGGCSPVGMKKLFPTFIDESAATLTEMVVSAGKVGLQLTIAPNDLARLTNATFADLTE
ncbi:MAG TPA: Cys-tRNA(Pro) deacylase [Firmicutes bacterium]|nr:Cys-tRNA(Pro) deacylase [Bacillota bacterium]